MSNVYDIVDVKQCSICARYAMLVEIGDLQIGRSTIVAFLSLLADCGRRPKYCIDANPSLTVLSMSKVSIDVGKISVPLDFRELSTIS